jgi:hypothetical protein
MPSPRSAPTRTSSGSSPRKPSLWAAAPSRATRWRSAHDRNGMLHPPRVGSFNVAGVRAADLDRNLLPQIGPAPFEPTVSLCQLRGLRVFVVVPAQRPGIVTLSSQSTMVSAMVSAGGAEPIAVNAQDPPAPGRPGHLRARVSEFGPTATRTCACRSCKALRSVACSKASQCARNLRRRDEWRRQRK